MTRQTIYRWLEEDGRSASIRVKAALDAALEVAIAHSIGDPGQMLAGLKSKDLTAKARRVEPALKNLPPGYRTTMTETEAHTIGWVVLPQCRPWQGGSNRPGGRARINFGPVSAPHAPLASLRPHGLANYSSHFNTSRYQFPTDFVTSDGMQPNPATITTTRSFGLFDEARQLAALQVAQSHVEEDQVSEATDVWLTVRIILDSVPDLFAAPAFDLLDGPVVALSFAHGYPAGRLCLVRTGFDAIWRVGERSGMSDVEEAREGWCSEEDGG